MRVSRLSRSEIATAFQNSSKVSGFQFFYKNLPPGWLGNEIVGQPFQPDSAYLISRTLGCLGQAGKPDLLLPVLLRLVFADDNL
jgi:hypothetical protein